MSINCDKTILNLKKRGFLPHFAEDTESAVKYILSVIPSGASVGFGGSVTVQQINLVDRMNGKYNLLYRDLFPAEKHLEVMERMHTADWYISSANAITEEGELINIDGRANRIGELIYGPKSILIIAGINKITKALEDGIRRARNIAAPLNAKRLNRKTPCVITGKCEYCNSPDTICKVTSIHHHPTTDKNVYVLLINETLGY